MGYESHPFFENVQNLMQISEMEEKIQEMSFLSEIIVSEFVALIYLY